MFLCLKECDLFSSEKSPSGWIWIFSIFRNRLLCQSETSIFNIYFRLFFSFFLMMNQIKLNCCKIVHMNTIKTLFFSFFLQNFLDFVCFSCKKQDIRIKVKDCMFHFYKKMIAEKRCNVKFWNWSFNSMDFSRYKMYIHESCKIEVSKNWFTG